MHLCFHQLDANDRIAQVVRLRNIAIPQADEDQSSNSGGPRLLRLLLTDGRTTLPAVDVENHEKLSSGTAPGTKLRLNGVIPMRSGFLLLRKSHLQVLGGTVAHLVKEWNMTKLAKSLCGHYSTGAPPFVPFGTPEARTLVQTENAFLRSLHSTRNRESAFDSFKIALDANAMEQDNEFDVGFQEKRKDVIAEVRKSDLPDDRKPAYMRFHAGGSKFAELQASKIQANDEALARLCALGYSTPLASSALKITKGDYQTALDHLIAKQLANSKLTDNSYVRGPSRRMGRGRGGRRDFDEMEDDPRFDPRAAAAAIGLRSQPSTGVTLFEDFLGTRTLNVKNPGPSSSRNSSHSTTLPVGCPILAQNMLGAYEEAHLVGYLTYPGSGDKVVLVVYRRECNGQFEEEEELVPLSLIRSSTKERLSIDMIPPAPPNRVKPYVSQSQGAGHLPSSSQQPVFTGHRSRGRGRGHRRGHPRGHRGYRT